MNSLSRSSDGYLVHTVCLMRRDCFPLSLWITELKTKCWTQVWHPLISFASSVLKPTSKFSSLHLFEQTLPIHEGKTIRYAQSQGQTSSMQSTAALPPQIPITDFHLISTLYYYSSHSSWIFLARCINLWATITMVTAAASTCILHFWPWRKSPMWGYISASHTWPK